jgi:hypothetical protein
MPATLPKNNDPSSDVPKPFRPSLPHSASLSFSNSPLDLLNELFLCIIVTDLKKNDRKIDRSCVCVCVRLCACVRARTREGAEARGEREILKCFESF